MKTKSALFVKTCILALLGSLIAGCSSNNDGYSGDLVPIKSEIDNIAGYEKVTQLILKNWDDINDEIKNPKKYENRAFDDLKSFRERKHSVIDSITKMEEQTLKLRFLGGGVYGREIEGKDTTITFKPTAGDFSMRGNWKDKDAGYTLFEHYIFYTTKPVQVFKNEDNADDTPSAVYRVKDRYYYAIYSRLEY